jgi:hypothetical protein
MTAGDDARLARLEHHLQHDPDLQARLRAGDTRGVLSEAARRTLKEDPAPGDLDRFGKVKEGARKRLIEKFSVLAFDLGDRRGFDAGDWAKSGARPGFFDAEGEQKP